MNYGRTFVLNHHTSRLNKGIVVFDYTGLQVNLSNFNEILPDTPLYPIYVIISRENIEFRAHYYDPKGNNANGMHLHSVILSLPLSGNLEVKDGLTTALSNSYNTTFPVKSADSNNNYLYNLFNAVSITKPDKILSYSDLDIFEVFSKTANEKGQFVFKKGEGGKIESFIRKLVLDFLFDFEHTKVFESSPHYEYVSVKLKENFFSNALACKAMFYYYRELINQRGLEYKGTPAQETTSKFYGNLLFEAENEWIKCIRDGKSDEAFHRSKHWFTDSEIEMNGIFSGRSVNEKMAYRQIIRDKEKDKEMENASQQTSRWFLRRYAFQNIFFSDGERRINFPLFLFILFFLFCIFSVVAVWVKDQDMWFISFDPHTFIKISTISNKFFFKWLSWIIFAITILLSITPLVKSYKKRFVGTHVFLPRLLTAIVAGWMSIFLSTDMLSFNAINPNAGSTNAPLKNVQQLINDGDMRLFILLILIFMSICFFVFYQIGKFNPHVKTLSKIIRAVFFCCIAFLYSSLIGKFFSVLFPSEVAVCQDQFFNFLQPLSKSYFLFTLLAMFIGIFIQMTFEDKPMTESL